MRLREKRVFLFPPTLTPLYLILALHFKIHHLLSTLPPPYPALSPFPLSSFLPPLHHSHHHPLVLSHPPRTGLNRLIHTICASRSHLEGQTPSYSGLGLALPRSFTKSSYGRKSYLSKAIQNAGVEVVSGKQSSLYRVLRALNTQGRFPP